MLLKKSVLSILFSLLVCMGYANLFNLDKDPAALVSAEIARLDTLIEATEQSLEGQKKLKRLIIEYRTLQEECDRNFQNNESLAKLVKCAYRTLKAIQENHLSLMFEPEFIDDLTVFSRPALKKGIPNETRNHK